MLPMDNSRLPYLLGALPASSAADGSDGVVERHREQTGTVQVASAAASCSTLAAAGRPGPGSVARRLAEVPHQWSTRFLPRLQQRRSQVLSSETMTGSLQDPASAAHSIRQESVEEGRDGRARRLHASHADHDISLGALPILISSDSDDNAPPAKRAARSSVAEPLSASGRATVVDTMAVVNEHGVPRDMPEWVRQQDVYFGGHPPLPPGWIRMWSHFDGVLYVRLSDYHATTQWNEMT